MQFSGIAVAQTSLGKMTVGYYCYSLLARQLRKHKAVYILWGAKAWINSFTMNWTSFFKLQKTEHCSQQIRHPPRALLLFFNSHTKLIMEMIMCSGLTLLTKCTRSCDHNHIVFHCNITFYIGLLKAWESCPHLSSISNVKTKMKNRLRMPWKPRNGIIVLIEKMIPLGINKIFYCSKLNLLYRERKKVFSPSGGWVKTGTYEPGRDLKKIWIDFAPSV